MSKYAYEVADRERAALEHKNEAMNNEIRKQEEVIELYTVKVDAARERIAFLKAEIFENDKSIDIFEQLKLKCNGTLEVGEPLR